MIHEFTKPIPVHTPLGDGYAIYVTSNGMLENDEWTVALEADGQVRHFLTKDIRVQKNATYGIAQEEQAKEAKDLLSDFFNKGFYTTSDMLHRNTMIELTKADNL